MILFRAWLALIFGYIFDYIYKSMHMSPLRCVFLLIQSFPKIRIMEIKLNSKWHTLLNEYFNYTGHDMNSLVRIQIKVICFLRTLTDLTSIYKSSVLFCRAWVALVFGLAVALGVCAICLVVFICMRCSNSTGSRKMSRDINDISKNTSQTTIAFLASSST